MQKNNVAYITVLFFVIMLASGVEATLPAILSDQGTAVRNKADFSPVLSGNLTVLIYTQLSGGTLIYNETFTNAIVNGSWNVIIGNNASNNLNLTYNTIYYKDYLINNEDVDFQNQTSTIARLPLQAPLGDVTTYSIADDAITTSQIADSTVTTQKITDSTILGTDINSSTTINALLINGTTVTQNDVLVCLADGTNCFFSGDNVSFFGSAGFIAQFQNATALNNSIIFQNETTGNVGIGTTSPDSKFHSVGSGGTWIGVARTGLFENTAAAGSIVEMKGTSGSAAFGISGTSVLLGSATAASDMRFYTANAEVARITAAGNVGIGTSTPPQKLTVGGDGANTFINIDSDAAQQTGLRWTKDGAEKWLAYVTGSSNDLRFWDGTDVRMTLQSGGNVGIGTTTPGTKLSLSGVVTTPYTSTGATLLPNTTEPFLSFLTGGQGAYIGAANDGAGFQPDLVFGRSLTSVAYAEAMRIDGDTGNVGIGTTSPNQKLEVNGTASESTPIRWKRGGATDKYGYLYSDLNGIGMSTAQNAVTQGFYINNVTSTIDFRNLNVGIGTTSPAKLLHVNSSGEVARLQSSSNITSQFTDGAWNTLGFAITGATTNNYGGIGFTDSAGGAGVTAIQTKFTDHANDYGELHFSTRGSSGIATRLIIQENGNVGINTSSPTYPLTVDANVSGISIWTRGNISATGYITRTSVWDNKLGSALNYFSNASQIKQNGKINHSKLSPHVITYPIDIKVGETIEYYNQTEVIDYQNVTKFREIVIQVPVNVTNNETNETFIEFEDQLTLEAYNESVPVYGNVTYNMTVPVYETKQEEGVLIDDILAKHDQAIYELLQKLSKLEQSLCELGKNEYC